MRYPFKNLIKLLYLLALLPNSVFPQSWQWQNPKPTGNKVRCSDFTDSLTAWFGCDAGVILHTIDGGTNWDIQYTGIGDLHIFAIDFIDPLEGWAVGTQSYDDDYVLHTTDGGQTWDIQLEDEFGQYTEVTFIDQMKGWVSDVNGILRTTDGGVTWSRCLDGAGYFESIFFLDKATGWASGENYLYRTDNGGISWNLDSTLTGDRIGSTGAVFFSDSLYGWYPAEEKIFRTKDGGETWLNDLPPLQFYQPSDIFFLDSLNGWVADEGQAIYHTFNGGQTWEKIQDSPPKFYAEPFRFFTRNSGWIDFNRTWDGGKTLQNQQTGFLVDRSLNDVDFLDENVGWVVGWNGTIAKTYDGGESWEVQLSNTNEYIVSICALNDMQAWAATQDGSILKTIDGGTTWNVLENEILNQYSSFNSIFFTDPLRGWVVGGDFSFRGWVLHTQDGGETWIDQTPGQVPRLFDVVFVNDSTGWMCAGGGSSLDSGNIFHSVDGGETWLPQLEYQQKGIEKLFFINDSVGWACGRYWLLQTNNGGREWIVQAEKIPYDDNWIYPEDIVFINPHLGWMCGLHGALAYTIDGGTNWHILNSGMTHTTNSLEAIDFVNEDTGWVVGWGTVLHTTDRGGTFVEEEKEIINMQSKYFCLYTNYPNPFHNRTMIPYKLSKSGYVKIRIFNSLGKEVRCLVNEWQQRGLHSVKWDGLSNMAEEATSGVYLYQILYNNDYSVTGKMLLIR